MSEIASHPYRPRGPGRPFEKGRSGNPAGRRPGSRNWATLAAETLLEGQSEALTQKAVERALEGSDLALKLCLDRILAPRRERTVHFALPPIESAHSGEGDRPIRPKVITDSGDRDHADERRKGPA